MILVKSLQFNKSDGVDIKQHRTHRSKKGQNKKNIATSPAVLRYKRIKKEKKYEDYLQY